MAGILDPGMLEQGGGLFGSLFAPIANNQNAILGYLAGALQGGGLGESIGRGLQGWVGGSQSDKQLAGQRGAMKYIAENPDIDPSLKQALVQNPALAMKYIEAAAKPGEFKTAGQLYGTYTPTGGFKPQGAAPEFKTLDPSQTAGYYTPPIPGGRTSPGAPGAVAPVQSGGLKLEDVSGLRKEATGMQQHAKASRADLDRYRGISERNRMRPEDVLPAIVPLLPASSGGWMVRPVPGGQ